MPTTPNPAGTRTDRQVTVLRDLLSPQALDTLQWKRWIEPGRTGTAIHTLYETDDDRPATAQLIRFDPGSHGDLHEHLGHELMFVLQGELLNDNGDRYRTGDLVVEQPGSVHRISTETGCTLLGIREAPVVPKN
ncbi:cupin domain-containing protein [Streptomyces sp. NPDC001935]|uniref:cupin domain-containing protein n=1 Tax=Streptomyces sp. NPDC056738 TaxID=3345933 RepID=UPI003692982B